MNEPKTTNESKKQKWIKTEHDKAVRIHWDNIDRIDKLKREISTKVYRVYDLQKSHNKLDCVDTEKYSNGTKVIRKEQIDLCIKVTDLQKQIDKNPFEKSVEIMQKNSNEEMLSRKYDRLFNKKTKEVK